MDIGCNRGTPRAAALAIISLGEFLRHIRATGAHEVTFLKREVQYRDGELFQVEEHGIFLVIPLSWSRVPEVPAEPPLFTDSYGSDGYSYWRVLE